MLQLKLISGARQIVNRTAIAAVDGLAVIFSAISPTFKALYEAKDGGANSTVKMNENVIVVLSKKGEKVKE